MALGRTLFGTGRKTKVMSGSSLSSDTSMPKLQVQVHAITSSLGNCDALCACFVSAALVGSHHADSLHVLHNFSGPDGQSPTGLIQASDGQIYGVGANGGDQESCDPDGCGVVFSLGLDGTFTKLHDFHADDARLRSLLRLFPGRNGGTGCAIPSHQLLHFAFALRGAFPAARTTFLTVFFAAGSALIFRSAFGAAVTFLVALAAIFGAADSADAGSG